CITTANVSLHVNEAPFISTATATPQSICEGESSVISAASSIITPVSGTVGTATGTNSLYPYYRTAGSSKTQMLYLASELTAIGLTAGNIYSVGFDVTTVGTNSNTPNVTISMKNTGATSLPLQETGLTEVYSTPLFVPVLGPNM